MAKKGRLFTNFVWMCDQDDDKGVDVGSAFRNDCRAQTFSSYFIVAAAIKRTRYGEGKICKVHLPHLWRHYRCQRDQRMKLSLSDIYAIAGKVYVHLLGLDSIKRADADGILAVNKKDDYNILRYEWGWLAGRKCWGKRPLEFQMSRWFTKSMTIKSVSKLVDVWGCVTCSEVFRSIIRAVQKASMVPYWKDDATCTWFGWEGRKSEDKPINIDTLYYRM